MTIEIDRPVNLQFDELSLGADLRWQVDGLLLQSEIVYNELAFVESYQRFRSVAGGESMACSDIDSTTA